MRHARWQILLGVALVASSALLYALHFLIFGDAHHIFLYLLGDIAFLPIQVLLVTLIIERVLGEREKQARLEKMNMVIGTFFSDVGTELLAVFSGCDPGIKALRKDLVVTGEWSGVEFSALARRLQRYEHDIAVSPADLEPLRTFLAGKREFLLRLLENPNLLEHESFTELLRAVFHLAEELEARTDMAHLPSSDIMHIASDMKRAYGSLTCQWLEYMRHLKEHYPYLFSFAMRTNPFDEAASPVVR